jgi:hypothetical protein
MPFAGSTSAVIFDAILNREPPAVQERNPALPAELAHIIGKALEKDRRLRYQSAAELYADLRRLKRDSSADRTTGAKPSHTVARRRSRVWLLLAVSALLLAAIAVTALILARKHNVTPRQFLATRLTSNTSNAPIEGVAVSPDGNYLAYSDVNGVHVRSMMAADSRLLPNTKGMSVQHWAATGTQFFVNEINQQKYYRVSLAEGVPRLDGTVLPSPDGQFSFIHSPDHVELRRAADGKIYSFYRNGAEVKAFAWSPHGKRLAVVFHKPRRGLMPNAFWTEVLYLERDRWTTIVPEQSEDIHGIAWLSESELVYAASERAPTQIYGR